MAIGCGFLLVVILLTGVVIGLWIGKIVDLQNYGNPRSQLAVGEYTLYYLEANPHDASKALVLIRGEKETDPLYVEIPASSLDGEVHFGAFPPGSARLQVVKIIGEDGKTRIVYRTLLMPQPQEGG
jgi:hypothetical protein